MKIGDVARRTRQVDHEDIELFAPMTGDRNPVLAERAVEFSEDGPGT